jgi:hypothetical protein
MTDGAKQLLEHHQKKVDKSKQSHRDSQKRYKQKRDAEAQVFAAAKDTTEPPEEPPPPEPPEEPPPLPVPEGPVYVSPPRPVWVQKYLPSDDSQIPIYKSDRTGRSVHWTSNIGPQTWLLMCPYDEILVGGRKGGSKSAGLIAWFAMGDPSLSPDDPARYSYLNEPSFRGLILREEYQALVEFIDEARDFFRPFGVHLADDPAILCFPSGAKIYTNHLGNKDAFEKYRGHGITKIGIEELAQIPDERRYVKLFGSLRSKKQIRVWPQEQLTQFWKRPCGGHTFPALKCQIMSTTNPDGPGAAWIKRRFIRVLDGKGEQIPWNTPMRDPISGLQRIFIPMRREDNPYLRDNKQYEGMLLSQDELTRRQWMEGDWDAAGGLMFSTYRPNGPVGAQEEKETPWARHVPLGPVTLRPWWYRWGSVDIGFDHPTATHKFCRNENDQRVHVYDEMTVRQMDAFEIGVLLAKWWIPDLEQLPDHQITLYLSPDAFNKTDVNKTRAEQMELGIKEVLGPYGALLLRFNNDERAIMARDNLMAQRMFDQRRQEFAGRMGIAIKLANDMRRDGCDYINQLLRFRPALHETEQDLKARLLETFSRAGVEAYERELAKARSAGPEVLPKIQIWAVCKELDRCLKEAMRGEPPKNEEYAKFNAVDGMGGDDALDSFRYGCMGFKEVQTNMPRSYFIGEKMNEAQQQHIAAFGEELKDQTRLRMISFTQASKYDKLHPAGGQKWTPPRASSSRHRPI